jgi:hypothetical protein
LNLREIEKIAKGFVLQAGRPDEPSDGSEQQRRHALT